MKSQEENLKYDMAELTKYHLTPIPYSLGTADGFFNEDQQIEKFGPPYKRCS